MNNRNYEKLLGFVPPRFMQRKLDKLGEKQFEIFKYFTDRVKILGNPVCPYSRSDFASRKGCVLANGRHNFTNYDDVLYALKDHRKSGYSNNGWFDFGLILQGMKLKANILICNLWGFNKRFPIQSVK